MAREMRNEMSLRQEEKGKSISMTRLIGIFRNALTLQASETATAIPLQIAGENPEKLGGKSNLEVAKAVAETLLRRARTLQ